MARVIIGNFVAVAPEVTFITGDHNSKVVGNYILENQKDTSCTEFDKDIVIEDDVWIGTRCIILKGVTIHEGAIVGAGSIVTKDVPPYTIVAGNPAKVIRSRFTDDELKKHKEIIQKKKNG